MGFSNNMMGNFLTLLTVLISSILALPKGRGDIEYDYYDNKPFHSDWIKHSDPIWIPPCPDWTPTDGCGRTPARTKSPTSTPDIIERTTPPLPTVFTTRVSKSYRLECTVEETRVAACLNKGECFVVEVFSSRSAHCQCLETWTGKRCEELDQDFYVLSADKIERAGIIAGVAVLIIIIIIFIIYMILKKRKQRKNRTEANGNANGHAAKALMSSEKEGMESEDAEKCTDV